MQTRWIATIATVLTFVTLGVPSAQASNPDLTVYRVRALVDRQPSTTVRDQERVTFRALARNDGPGTSSMYVTYSNTRRLHIKSEACIIPASEVGDFGDVSADTPSCEWTDVPEGDYAIVRVRAVAVGEPGERVRITFCSSNGLGTDDGDPSNDCKTTRLTISA